MPSAPSHRVALPTGAPRPGMGIFDTLREVLGVRAETDAARNADPDDLFGMTTAYVTT